MTNYTFTKPAELHEDKLFSTDRAHNALDFNALANNHVRQVHDEPGQWTQVAEQAGAQVLSSVFPHSNAALQAQSALVRSALRGAGRGRDRR